MERSAEYKLKNLGIPEGYNGFSYMCYIITHYNSYDEPNLSINSMLKSVAEKFDVTEKTVTSNLTLLAKRAWENGRMREIFKWDCVPTLKEFVYALIVFSEQVA